jgi:hypothetical protein
MDCLPGTASSGSWPEGSIAPITSPSPITNAKVFFDMVAV